ncbi:hypothetical protein ABZ782_08710 [Streptomyces asoensis]|uniref:hypothetical protein n=1 Tax=Streptomyces asoensis TaxID=249586 RepID=UPI0033CD07E1
MSIADTSIAAASAAFSGVAALAAWRASREANSTAASVAQIERDRWHNDLTPQLRLMVREAYRDMIVRFDGPASLGRLTLQLHVRDDRDRSQDPVLAGSVTQEMRAEVIWGPYRFRPGIDGADERGRAVSPFTLEPGDRTKVAIDPSLRPTWYEGPDGERRWRDEYRTARMRLWAECQAPGHKPWRLSFEVSRDGNWACTPPMAGV